MTGQVIAIRSTEPESGIRCIHRCQLALCPTCAPARFAIDQHPVKPVAICTACYGQSWRAQAPRCCVCGLAHADEEPVRADANRRRPSALATAMGGG